MRPPKGRIEKAVGTTGGLKHPNLVIVASGRGKNRKREGFLCASDAYKMVVSPVELDESDTEGLVPISAIKASRGSTMPIELNSAIVSGDISTPAVTVPGETTVPRPEATAPKYLDLIAKAEAKTITCKISLNAKLLHDLAQALGDDQVELSIAGDMDAIRVNAYNGGENKGLLMPIRPKASK